MRFKKTFIIFIISIILLNLSIIFATNANNNNIDNFFRIHVVANSDSIDDQLLKYVVAKNVNEYIGTITSNSSSKQESKSIITSNMQNILNLCNNVITREGYAYNITGYVGKLEYDEKESDNIYMKRGIYDSVKIVIGDGLGQNWWSLIYPTNLNLELQQDSKDSNNIEYRFFIIDWVEALFSN